MSVSRSNGELEEPQDSFADEEFDVAFEVGEDALSLVPEGNYWAQFVKSEQRQFFKTPKLYVWFKLVQPGPHQGTKIFRAYNLYKPLRRGSDLYKDLVMLSGVRASKRAKLSTALFKNKVIGIAVRTVSRNRKQEAVGEHQKYSVVDRLLCIHAGGK